MACGAIWVWRLDSGANNLQVVVAALGEFVVDVSLQLISAQRERERESDG